MAQFGIPKYDEGIMLSLALGGQSHASDRAELLGACAALYKPGPAHIGIDSAACLAVANFLLTIAPNVKKEDDPGLPKHQTPPPSARQRQN